MKQNTIFIVTVVALLLVFIAGATVYKSEKAKSDQSAQVAERNRPYLSRMHSPTLGKADAKVQLVEFFDPACGTCREFYPLVKKILAANPDQILLVLRYAPFHDGSEAVVAALEAARKQEKLWPALEALLASQESWAPHHKPQLDLIWKPLESTGVNLDQVRADMGSPEIARVIRQDLDDAKALNVTMTPEFFVNGKPLPSFGQEQLKTLVDEALGSARR